MSVDIKYFTTKTFSGGNGANFCAYDGVSANHTIGNTKEVGFFNLQARSLTVGDLIICSCIDGTAIYLVSSNPTFGGDGALVGNLMFDDYSQNAIPTQKISCKVATTQNISLMSLQTIDGYTTLAGDRVLVKNQVDKRFNGIYIANSGAWIRASDSDIYSEFLYSNVYVESGAVNANTGWVFNNPSGGIINVTDINVIKFSAGGATSSIGDYKDSAINSNHAGWTLCDGSAVSRTVYSSLFAVIGTSFGAGDGSTTFNLPDGRGRTLGYIGASSGLTNRIMGQKVGTETHALTTGEMPAHSHAVTDPGHTHNLSPAGHWYFGTTYGRIQNFYSSGYFPAEGAGTIANSVTAITVQNSGSGNAHNNMSPYLFGANLFIYTGI